MADVIIPLSDVMGENMKKEQFLFCSGIIDTKEEEVKASLEKNNFTILEVNRMGDWVSFISKNKPVILPVIFCVLIETYIFRTSV